MSTQLWDLTLIAPVISVDGVGNTLSQSADAGVGTPQAWPMTLVDGTLVSGSGSGNTTSIGVGDAAGGTWYTITADVNSSGFGNTLSQAVDIGVGTNNPTAATGIANTLSQAADFAPFTVIAPPSVTGIGNTISSAYGTALRSFNTIGQDTEGVFDIDQQTTDSVLVRPTASGDFIIDGLPLPS